MAFVHFFAANHDGASTLTVDVAPDCVDDRGSRNALEIAQLIPAAAHRRLLHRKNGHR
jgi:hypothetical protein